MKATRERRPAWVGVATFVVLAAAWYVLTTLTHTIGSGRFPAPGETWDALRQITITGYADARLHQHILHSVKLVLFGFAAATIVGVPLGLAMGASRAFEAFINPSFLLIRPIPPLAWIPLAILWLGIGDSARIFVVFIAAIVPWVMNSMQAVYSIDGLLVRAAMTLGASDRQILTRVVCRTALPTLVAGARIALGNAWTTLVAAELLAATSGLGYIALNASRTLEMGILLVAMAIIGILGACFAIGMQLLTRLVAPWAST